MDDRKIGRVISVDSFRIVVELEGDLRGSYKNGYYDIYEVAKINSYIIIPVMDEKIVALITRVKINDETDIETFTGVVNLPKSKRYIVATMIGTIIGDSNENHNYIQGVYNFPVLDNPVWYVIKSELEIIFDYKKNDKNLDFKNDYFLPIGTSPVFKDFEVKINLDKFFGKHAAILGNTGSGKSCTVAAIIQSIFSNEFNDHFINNAHFIIFDTNGEYKSAFEFCDSEIKKRANAFTIEEKGLKIPYWFMNYDDFDYLFKPSANTQSPILKRAIELAKNELEAKKNDKIPEYVKKVLIYIMNLCIEPVGHEKLKEILYEEIDDLRKYDELKDIFNFDVNQYITKNKSQNGRYYYNDASKYINSKLENKLYKKIKNKLNVIYGDENQRKIKEEKNIDIPKYFNFKELIGKYIDAAIKEQSENNSSNKINEFVSTLRLRLSSFCSDERFSEPFMIDKKDDENNLLVKFLEYIFGVTKNNGSSDEFQKYKFDENTMKNKNLYSKENYSQITIIDMSLLSCEVLENVTALIGRIILEFLSRIDKCDNRKRGDFPTVIVLEEAQNYIPEKDENKDRISISKKVFERIAREGRKFGLSLVISSQRPSELSKTILSQCNTFIVHRIQNPDDQKYIRQLVSSVNEDILDQLPILPQQHAFILGDAVRSPVEVKLQNVNPKPNSENPEFFDKWVSKEGTDKLDGNVIEKVVNIWTNQ